MAGTNDDPERSGFVNIHQIVRLVGQLLVKRLIAPCFQPSWRLPGVQCIEQIAWGLDHARLALRLIDSPLRRAFEGTSTRLG